MYARQDNFELPYMNIHQRMKEKLTNGLCKVFAVETAAGIIRNCTSRV